MAADNTAPKRIVETLTVREACAQIGISVNSGYAAIRRNELPAIKIGRRLVVPRRAFEQWLASAGSVRRSAP